MWVHLYKHLLYKTVMSGREKQVRMETRDNNYI